MSGFFESTRKFFKSCPEIRKLSLLIIISALLVFIGVPSQPHTVISGIKNVKSATVEIDLPVVRLSKKLSVIQCSDTSLNNLYSEPTIYNAAKSGINVFKKRLAKEIKSSISNLSTQLLNTYDDSAANSKTCIVPLKINAEKKLAKQLAAPNLLEVSLGSQSVFCSNKKAYVLSGSDFFPVGESLASYGSQITKKKIIVELTRKLEAVNTKKRALPASKKTELEAINQEIRKINLSISYAKYFANDSKNLGLLFDEICKQVAIVTTPNALPPGARIPIATGVATAISTSTPFQIATPTPIATISLPGRPSAPSITNPSLQNVSNSLTISWQSSSQRFLIGAVNKTNNIDIFFEPDFKGFSYNLNVVAGNSYRFWIRARKDIYDPNNPASFSEISEITFTVPGVTPILTPTQTSLPTITLTPVVTIIPTIVNGKTKPTLDTTGPRKSSLPNITYKRFADGDWRTADGLTRAPFNFANGERTLIVNPGDNLVFKRINFQGPMNIGPVWNYDNSNSTPTSVTFEDCTFDILQISTVGKMRVNVSYSKAAYLAVGPSPDSLVTLNNIAIVNAFGGDAGRIGRNTAFGATSRTPVIIRDSIIKTSGANKQGDHRDAMQVFGGAAITFDNVVFDLNWGEFSGVSDGQNVSLFLEDRSNGGIYDLDIIDCWIVGSGGYFLGGFQKTQAITKNIRLIRPKFSKDMAVTPDYIAFKSGAYTVVDPVYAEDLTPISSIKFFGP